MSEDIPKPNPGLTPDAQDVWASVFRARGTGWWGEDLRPLLALYCAHAATCRHLSAAVDKGFEQGVMFVELDEFDRLLKLRALATARLEALGRLLYITHQRRMTTRTAARKASDPPAGRLRPWESDPGGG